MSILTAVHLTTMWGPQMMANWKSSGNWPIFVRQNTDPILQKLITDKESEQEVLQCSVLPALTFITSVQLRNFFCNLYGNPFEMCTEKQLRNGSQPNCKLFWQILTLILPTVTLTSIVQDVYKQVHTVQLQAFTDTNKAHPHISKIPRKARWAK